jgi:ribonuclease III
MTPLEEALGVELDDRDLLTQSLTHRSHAFEAGGLPTNERLEFLGDAVLGLVVTRRVYEDHPGEPEGRLAKLRSAAVNTQSLAELARTLGVGDAVLLGRGEEQSGGRDKDSILADTLEALIGAVYLDRGLEVVTEMVERLFGTLLHELRSRHASLDYKTSLQELVAGRGQGVPEYAVSDSGPDHSKEFLAVVLVAGQEYGHGEGRSKKEAEQAAAQRAYRTLSDEP